MSDERVSRHHAVSRHGPVFLTHPLLILVAHIVLTDAESVVNRIFQNDSEMLMRLLTSRSMDDTVGAVIELHIVQYSSSSMQHDMNYDIVLVPLHNVITKIISLSISW
jgi:hypothetical protein